VAPRGGDGPDGGAARHPVAHGHRRVDRLDGAAQPVVVQHGQHRAVDDHARERHGPGAGRAHGCADGGREVRPAVPGEPRLRGAVERDDDGDRLHGGDPRVGRRRARPAGRAGWSGAEHDRRAREHRGEERGRETPRSGGGGGGAGAKGHRPTVPDRGRHAGVAARRPGDAAAPGSLWRTRCPLAARRPPAPDRPGDDAGPVRTVRTVPAVTSRACRARTPVR
jgi:hypothetical protein